MPRRRIRFQRSRPDRRTLPTLLPGQHDRPTEPRDLEGINLVAAVLMSDTPVGETIELRCDRTISVTAGDPPVMVAWVAGDPATPTVDDVYRRGVRVLPPSPGVQVGSSFQIINAGDWADDAGRQLLFPQATPILQGIYPTAVIRTGTKTARWDFNANLTLVGVAADDLKVGANTGALAAPTSAAQTDANSITCTYAADVTTNDVWRIEDDATIETQFVEHWLMGTGLNGDLG